MIKLKLKALSLNSAYRGRRFTTPALKAYKEAIRYLSPILPQIDGKLQVFYRFGVSSKNSDGDNLIKCLQDGLADRYGFNDKMIYKWEVEKVDVKKGEEFVEYEINKLK
jgi:Holliday junction resolvase RusA-like endonuclease